MFLRAVRFGGAGAQLAQEIAKSSSIVLGKSHLLSGGGWWVASIRRISPAVASMAEATMLRICAKNAIEGSVITASGMGAAAL
jgi:hypothetical protein